MNTSTVQSAQAGINSSSWRLVNLALGLAALLGFAGASGFFPLLVPSRWLLAPWLTASSTMTVPPLAVLAARVGVNLWLFASVFMALFWLAGLHRKLGAPRAKWASSVLGLGWVANVLLTFVSTMVGRGEGAGALAFAFGMVLGPVYVALIVAIIIAAAAELTAIIRYTGSTRPRVPIALISWAVVPPVLSVAPLLFAPSNPLALSAKEKAQFVALCKDVGVQLMEKPVAQVRSIAYDWDPQRLNGRPLVDRIETDSDGRIRMYGGFADRNSAEAGKNLEFEFTESRRDPYRAGRATINPDAPYYRFPNKQPYHGIDAFSADVLGFLDVNSPEELRKPYVQRGAVRYKLTLTDRRSGAVLGVQTYVVDEVNKRACGVNIGNTISQNAFIYDAIHR